MAEKIVSPGVFTNEKDLSFLPAGIAQIGGAFIGPATKGPAYVPIALDSVTDFERVFGKLNPNFYMPFAVKEYIQNGGRATIVRTMNDNGYEIKNGIVAIYADSGSTALSNSPTITVSSVVDYDTGSSAANASITPSKLTEYRKLVYTPAGAEYNSTSYLNDLKFYSSSILLTETGNAFISASKISTVITGSLISVGLGGTTTTFTVDNRFSSASAYNKLLLTLHPTEKVTDAIYYDGSTNLFQNSDTTELIQALEFGVSVNGTATGGTIVRYSASIDRQSDNFISKVFPQNPGTSDDYVYLYNIFGKLADSLSGSASTENFFIQTGNMEFSGDRTDSNSGAGHTYASTPWVISQTANNTNYPLFKLNTLSEGTNANYEVKVGISNIRPAGKVPGSSYGDFTVTVRYVDQSLILNSPFDTVDSDLRPNVIETFNLCNLDPSSKNYIGRKIGDRYEYFDTATNRVVVEGDYPNKSKYIRVEIDNRVKEGAYSPDLVPFGHKAVMVPLSSSFYSGNYVYPAAALKTVQQDANGVYNKKVYFGFDYDFSKTDNLNYLKPIPTGATVGSNSAFLLSNCTQDVSAVSPSYTGSVDLTSNTSVETRKFMLPFQLGFDGTYPNKVRATGDQIAVDNCQGYDFSTVNSDGYVQYKKAVDTIASPTSIDINMLVMPGMIHEYHSNIIAYAEQVAQDRGDTFFIFDVSRLDAAPNEAVDEIKGWDSNYAATYYPWVKVIEPTSNRPIWVPPSVVIPGVLAFNDKVGEQWFAPAGLNRGGLAVNDVYARLNRTDIDTLYDGRINPIATIPNIGFAVWGQKTLQAKPSALDRINVRRLLIALKKYIASASQYLVFEQNTSATRNRFLNIVNPYMESVQQRQGLYAFKVVMDDTNNTPDLIDRNIMYGQIYLQPARTAEFIIIDFNILPTGATFGA